MDFDLVDVNDFGHALNDDVQLLALEQAADDLDSACARAKTDLAFRQAVLWEEGKGKFCRKSRAPFSHVALLAVVHGLNIFAAF